MFQISIPRIQRYALILGVVGTVLMGVLRSIPEGAAFLTGAALSLVTIESWSRIAAALNPEAQTKPSAAASGVFLAVRYLIIAAAIYVTIKVLGLTPVAMLLGMLTAFAAVLMKFLRDTGVPWDKVNVNGGAIALGHPLGASGVRLVTTAVSQLHAIGARYALCTMCVGVGQGIAVVLERS